MTAIRYQLTADRLMSRRGAPLAAIASTQSSTLVISSEVEKSQSSTHPC